MKTKGRAMSQASLDRLNEASDWLLRLESTQHTQEEVSEWLRWCDAHPENVEAFEKLQRDWHDLDALKGEAERPTAPPSRWRLAAAVAAIAVTTSLIGYSFMVRTPVQRVIATMANKAATLPDGSSVILSARTQVNVDFTDTHRQLKLSQGEAYFKVRHDRKRPFVVHVGEIDVAAVGTAFNVRRESENVTVIVEEGVVEVSSPLASGEGPNIWRAEAGYRLTYSARDHTATLASVNPEALLKWRSGELAYVWQPLSQVIDDLNRYSERKIVIKDESLSHLRFTGTVFTASVDDWLTAVRQTYPVRIETARNGDILLRSRPIASGAEAQERPARAQVQK